MIPFIEWKIIELGPFTIQVWGLFAGLGVVAGSWFAVHEAKRRGLDAKAFESLALWIVVWAFLGARLAHVFLYEPAWYLGHPLDILKIWHGGWSSVGGFAGAAAAFFWGSKRRGLPVLRAADHMTAGAALGLACGRIGCFFIHDHPGTLAHEGWEWLAVNYPDGARYDLGLLLGALDVILLLAYFAVFRRRRTHGVFFGFSMLVYGAARFGLDLLRAADLPGSDIRYAGLTPAQYASIALFAAGFVLLFRIGRKAAAAPMVIEYKAQ